MSLFCDDAGNIWTGLLDPVTTMVPNAFEIGEKEVTYELWYAVHEWAVNGLGGAPGEGQYEFNNPGAEGHDGIDGEPPTEAKLEPLTYVTWRDTIVWCNALTEYYNAKENQSLECVYQYNNAVIRSSRN